jgi:hypothetical protein
MLGNSIRGLDERSCLVVQCKDCCAIQERLPARNLANPAGGIRARAIYDLPHLTYVWMTSDYDISFRVRPEVIWEKWEGDLLTKSEFVRRRVSIIETDGACHGRRDDKFFSVLGEDQPYAINKL